MSVHQLPIEVLQNRVWRDVEVRVLCFRVCRDLRQMLLGSGFDYAMTTLAMALGEPGGLARVRRDLAGATARCQSRRDQPYETKRALLEHYQCLREFLSVSDRDNKSNRELSSSEWWGRMQLERDGGRLCRGATSSDFELTCLKIELGWSQLHWEAARGVRGQVESCLGKVDGWFWEEGTAESILPNARALSGETPLHLAARKGHLGAVQALLGASAVQAKATDFLGWTPLECAAACGHFACFEALFEFSEGTKAQILGRAFKFAARGGKVEFLEQLLPKVVMDVEGARIMYSHFGQALGAAAALGHLAVVELFLGQWELPLSDLSDQWGQTALMKASVGGHRRVVEALVTAGGKEVVLKQDLKGETALMKASLDGHLDVVEELAASIRGKEQNLVQDKKGETALMKASFVGHLSIVKELLLAGGGKQAVSVANKRGETALMMASSQGHVDIVEELVTAGGERALVAADKWHETALMKAASGGHARVVEALVAAGGPRSVLQHDNKGKTALMRAAFKGHARVVEALVPAGGKRALMARDWDGRTALMMASQKGHEGIVYLLRAAGGS
uniref:Uncharacterized protein n=2 Tax=Hemiselmis andersenii TaxID=464988 RepID=A0A6U2CNT0_HEMAN|mmetsp:Transcript_20513/g.47378  ORF Transcript_20513/g.47378 Transcript_20513/m.47378 type:complete len:567 (+) Transcript_20513:68-1768(+)|eukprot:CAMPEP_0172017498 /NCGR_PEP_ID=MMETSP1041-20130122/11596_1 /TAXON_ID=464988 /ORGANISM="Hemiselmis andersenii, Strain CCMP439" /LENGTH=566 /DNA_ID=CAMNT_0012672531 /DNA_START=17 /DNA_END=1717 /DNA_ORIENTATION=+